MPLLNLDWTVMTSFGGGGRWENASEIKLKTAVKECKGRILTAYGDDGETGHTEKKDEPGGNALIIRLNPF